VYKFTTPLFEIAPYETFCILLLIIFSTIYLRRLILNYAEKNLPHCFTEFNLNEEQQEDTASLALYRYIMSNTFEQTRDPIFIAMCKRYIRWGQLFIVSFAIALIDIEIIGRVLSV
jgi:hypothetical protein